MSASGEPPPSSSPPPWRGRRDGGPSPSVLPATPPGWVAVRTERGPPWETVPLSLTDQEQALFATLRRFVAVQGLPTTLRVAGGWVRDKLLGGPMARVDIDLAVDIPSGTEFAKLLRQWLRGEGAVATEGSSTTEVGVIRRCPARSKHLETARLSVLGLSLDVVSLRTEAYVAGSRIPAVAWGTPREDAFRRDFTINALFFNASEGVVEDWTGRGVGDLRRRLVRTPLPPQTTLLDDPLRALRAVRFAARLAFSVDPGLAAAARAAAVRRAFAEKISRERVAAELDAILTAPSAVRGVGLLAHLRLLPLVLPSVVPPAVDAASSGGSGWPRYPPTSGAASGGPSPSWTAVPAGPAAAAATGALASLEALRLADFGGWAAASAALSADEVRLARYAALTLPLAGPGAAPASGTEDHPSTRREQQPLSAIAVALREELRMAARDVAAVVGVHRAADAFRALATTDCLAGALFRKADWLGADDGSPRAPPLSASPPLGGERLALGLATRAAGPHWRVSLLTALVGDLPPGGAAANVLDGDYTPTATLAAGARTDSVVAAYERVARRIRQADVADAAAVRPLLNGTAVAALLPHLPRGPLVGEILEQQVRWRLAHPRLSAKTCAEWIIAEYGDARG